MKRSTKRILTTHTGSLVRTAEIIEAMIRKDLAMAVEEEVFAGDLRKGVQEVVRKQEQIGLDVIDDGEFGKTNWVAYVTDRMSGLELQTRGRGKDAPPMRWPEQGRYGDFYRRYQADEYSHWLPDTPSKAEYVRRGAAFQIAVCKGPLAYRPAALKRDLDNLKAALQHVKVEEAFVPVAAPCSIEYMPNQYYKSQEEFLFSIAEALSVEYKMIVDAGFLLQIDDAIFPMQYVMQFGATDLPKFRKWAAVRVEALNEALKGIPEESVRYHICFGSQNIPHTTDAGLKDIIEFVLAVKAQGYLIEACNPRHEHEWQLWKEVKLPDGKILVPGVLSHATNIVEHPELIALRIERFASLVGRENVIAGSDCGFSQGWNIIRVHEQIQWAKLQSMVEGARLASERLWN